MFQVSLINFHPVPPQRISIIVEGDDSYRLFDLLVKVIVGGGFMPEERKLADKIVAAINDLAKGQS